MKPRSALALSLLVVIGCSESAPEIRSPEPAPGVCTEDQLAALEASMATALDAAATDANLTSTPDFTVLLETWDGRTFTYAHGTATPTTRFESASTSKLVTAAVILDRVEQGALTLETKASALLPFWTEETVSLRHLLSFTSGYATEPACLNNPAAVFENCVKLMYTGVKAPKPAGTEFYYAGTHEQIAGLMAMKAASVATWTELFTAFTTRTGLFPTAAYDLPSATNPRLAGGMHWTAEEYVGFLRALSLGTLLGDDLRAELFANQRGSATVTFSPTFRSNTEKSLNEDWSYGLGNWLECPTATTANSFDCGAGHRNASPGAFGAYPFIDFDSRYFGILARQGALGTYTEGVKTFRVVETLAKAWARRECPAN